jgi:rod shape determining protein RodA
MWSRLKTLDLALLVIPLLLVGIGIAVIYSITITNPESDLAARQGWFLLAGLFLYAFFTLVDYRSLRAWSWVIYAATISLLIMVRFAGEVVYGSRRWIDLGFFQPQPSEFAKIAVIVILARLLGDWINRPRGRQLLIGLVLLVLPVLFILDQPDLGSAIAVFSAGAGVLLLSGLSRKQWLAVGASLLLALVIAFGSWKQIGPLGGLLKDYQRQRVETWLNPQADASGSGYNVLQALIAIGSGGVLGQGLGYGSQSQLNFLPVAHTDFLFAALAESWGFLGTTAVVVLYWLLLWRLIAAARVARDGFSKLLCLGAAVLFFVQVTVNIGMNLALLPVTGITLPLMSYGGSSLLTMLALLGMVQSVVIREKRLNFS